MTDASKLSEPPKPANAKDPSREEARQAELAMGRTVAWALPVAVLVIAIGVDLVIGLGPAILALAGGALLGTVTFFWVSLRTLSGDAPLAEGFDLGAARWLSIGSADERKRAALRALKDLAFERSVGKLGDDDYAALEERYRAEAKAIMREMDVAIDPLRDRAEDVARQYLVKRGMSAGSAPAHASHGAAEPEPSSPSVDDVDVERPSTRANRATRVACPSCATSNEPDADFCKKCGAGLVRVCGKCSTRNEPDADFCKKCGGKLGAKETSADA